MWINVCEKVTSPSKNKNTYAMKQIITEPLEKVAKIATLKLQFRVSDIELFNVLSMSGKMYFLHFRFSLVDLCKEPWENSVFFFILLCTSQKYSKYILFWCLQHSFYILCGYIGMPFC